MDLLARELLHEVLVRRRAAGRTAILVSHGLDDIERVCDQVAVLKYGEIAFAGPLERLLVQENGEPTHLQHALQPFYASAQ
jgi:ABC-type multidrug transport system ATPase subunit